MYSSASLLILIALFILGIAFLTIGSNTLLLGGRRLAKILSMKEYTIGLTLVALSTSMPEFFVSIKAALAGLPDIAFTNVVGSNIFNSMFIYALLLLFMKGKTNISLQNLLSLTLLSSVLVLYVFLGTIPRYLGIVLLALLPLYVWMQVRIKVGGDGYNQNKEIEASLSNKDLPVHEHITRYKKFVFCLKSLLYIGLGTVFLYLGSELFLNSSLELGDRIGISQRILGLVLISIGTGLPEFFVILITLLSLLSSKEKNFTELGEGNLLGSNIINILLIVACSVLVNPIHNLFLFRIDILVLLLSNIVLFVLLSKKIRVQRLVAVFFLLMYAVYLVFLFKTN